ncbi:MAG: hypothetical protein ACLGIG_10655 [Actinomycetes bacterium]
MTHDATHDPLARLLRWRPRPPADAAGRPDVPHSPDAVQLGALLDDIGSLRLSLSVDMDVLASAVDLRAYEVASEVVDGERADLAAFVDRAAARLASHDACQAPPAPVRRGVVRVLRAALPAAPALAAAAALIGVLAGLAPGPRTTAPDPFAASNAGFADLFGVEPTTSTAERDAAEALREEVVRVMALAMHDPRAAAEALQSLSARVEQVEDDAEREALRDALAEVARLLASLEAALGAGADTVDAVAPDLRQGPRPLPLPPPSLGTSPTAADADADAGSTSEDPTPEEAAAAEPTESTPSPTPSPTGSEAAVTDVLDGGAANGSTGVLPKSSPGGLE